MGRNYSDCRASELTDRQVSGFYWFLENTEKTKASSETFLRLMPWLVFSFFRPPPHPPPISPNFSLPCPLSHIFSLPTLFYPDSSAVFTLPVHTPFLVVWTLQLAHTSPSTHPPCQPPKPPPAPSPPPPPAPHCLPFPYPVPPAQQFPPLWLLLVNFGTVGA